MFGLASCHNPPYPPLTNEALTLAVGDRDGDTNDRGGSPVAATSMRNFSQYVLSATMIDEEWISQLINFFFSESDSIFKYFLFSPDLIYDFPIIWQLLIYYGDEIFHS